jgi:hypothetical protein
MRAKVILSVSALALAVLAPAVYFHFKPDSPPPAPQQPAATAENTASSALPPILKRAQVHPQEGLPDRPVPAPSSGTGTGDPIMDARADLAERGMSSDPADLKIILSQMENPEPSIRKAALDAAISFGSRDAIPVLQNEMAYATDPQEKVDIKKAIEFLQLPHIGEGDTGSVTQNQ